MYGDRRTGELSAAVAGNCALAWRDPNGELGASLGCSRRSHAGQAALRRHVDNFEGIASVEFPSKHDKGTGLRIRQFEAADLLAWVLRNTGWSTYRVEDYEPGSLVYELAKQIPIQEGLFIEGNLRKHCEEMVREGLLEQPSGGGS